MNSANCHEDYQNRSAQNNTSEPPNSAPSGSVETAIVGTASQVYTTKVEALAEVGKAQGADLGKVGQGVNKGVKGANAIVSMATTASDVQTDVDGGMAIDDAIVKNGASTLTTTSAGLIGAGVAAAVCTAATGGVCGAAAVIMGAVAGISTELSGASDKVGEIAVEKYQEIKE